MATESTRIPGATYRLQFNRHFTFADAEALLPYLHALGVTDLYASPLFPARAGSLHGYDVTDHGRLNPELGPEESFRRFADALRRRGMGLLLDVVPNHMCIADPGNRWWNDILENGPSSPFAGFFDIDWRPPKTELADKVLLPFLGDQYGRVLENQELRVVQGGGSLFVVYYETRLPLAPKTWIPVLEAVLRRVAERLPDPDANRMELESVLTALRYLPPRSETDPDRVRERMREKEVIKGRLARLLEVSADVREALEAELLVLNGRRRDPRSFDALERLIGNEAYRLCFWRVAADEINYRRFFDINELAALRVEVPEVFAAAHALVFDLVRQGIVTGLRIDHVDGLYDPEQYLHDVQAACRSARGGDVPAGPRPFFVVVEKILEGDEVLNPAWPVHGTTGYDFLNQLNGLFVDARGEGAIRRLFTGLAGRPEAFADLLCTCKKFILLVSMASELRVLACRLDRISEQHRWSRDFTQESLRFALREVIACFPVYRSYSRPGQAEVDAVDRRRITDAVEEAKRRNPATDASLFDFIGSVLLLQDPEGLGDAERAERREFVLRFQQLTGPVMAKGLEDTAFYRYVPLVSLNEVGGDPCRFGLSLDEFHRRNRERALRWPASLLATATHDTKRGEDVRARLNVLSEIPEAWEAAVTRWRTMNRGHKVRVGRGEAPDPVLEYLLYQTLVGAWPLAGGEEARFRERVREYMLKAVREAKVHTSWISPHPDYESALCDFTEALLDEGRAREFLADLRAFVAPVALAGALNSLAQVLLKIAAPGVPDFYQGAELWDLRLVDPDNRRPVDFAPARALLEDLERKTGADRPALLRELLAAWPDGRIKLYLTAAALTFRRDREALFACGDYLPLVAGGETREHVVAFARRRGPAWAVAAVPRLAAARTAGGRFPLGAEAWRGSALALPQDAPARWRNALTGEVVETAAATGGPSLSLAAAFRAFPVALLEGGGGLTGC